MKKKNEESLAWFDLNLYLCNVFLNITGMKKLTEEKLEAIVKGVVRQLLEETDIITEMAVERKSYFQYGINQSATVLKHIGKICVYEDDARMSHWVNHWEDEIAAQIYDLGKIDVTKDPTHKVKKKAFVQSFIESRLGKDFSEYDDKMYSYINDGLEDEGLTKDQINSIDTKGIAQANKERIRRYLFSFVDVLSIKDISELKEKCKMLAHQF